MYNGQYAKGALHLIVFVVLLSLADNLNWVFYWFVWGWIFYQAFDAYHTARARRDGDALPNPFGWNDIGDRLGFGNNSTVGGPAAGAPPPPTAPPYVPMADFAPPVATPPEPVPYAPSVAGRKAEANYAPGGPSSASSRSFGENPYAGSFVPHRGSFGPASSSGASTSVAPGMSVPYTNTFAGSVSAPGSVSTVPAPLTGIRRFPAGAAWLIGLGTLFLLGNLQPEWRLGSRWMVPILLAGIAVWSGLRRWEQLRTLQGPTLPSSNFAGAIVGPLVLLTLASLLALDAGHLVTIRRSWPALLVVWGALLTVQRTTGAGNLTAPPLEFPRAAPPPPPVRSSSGTGSLGL